MVFSSSATQSHLVQQHPSGAQYHLLVSHHQPTIITTAGPDAINNANGSNALLTIHPHYSETLPHQQPQHYQPATLIASAPINPTVSAGAGRYSIGGPYLAAPGALPPQLVMTDILIKLILFSRIKTFLKF